MVEDPKARLGAAYAAAIYQVEDETPWTLRVGVPAPELSRLYQVHSFNTATLITAFNPGSDMLPATDNQQRHQHLLNTTKPWALPTYQTVARDPEGKWPDEVGILVFGLSWPEARAVGLRFGQNAVLWADQGAKPSLLWCEEKTDRCVTCGRQVPLTFHHLIPKKLHRRPRFKKQYSPRELQRGIYVCRTCHTGIHRRLDEMTLGQHYNDLLALHLQPDLQRHFHWAAKQKRQR